MVSEELYVKAYKAVEEALGSPEYKAIRPRNREEQALFLTKIVVEAIGETLAVEHEPWDFTDLDAGADMAGLYSNKED